MTFMGNLFVVAAPSGGGKTSLVNHLVTKVTAVEISISHTTRLPRPNEQSGKDYFFITQEQFMDMIKVDAFVEYAQVFGHYYGTSIAQISQRLEKGIDVILDIDWQGSQQIKRLFPKAITIFILPPSLEILKQRLCNRAQDSLATIKARMAEAQSELKHYSEFDYLIINDTFDEALSDLIHIITANRLNMIRQSYKFNEMLIKLLKSD